MTETPLSCAEDQHTEWKSSWRDETNSIHDYMRDLRKQLLEREVLVAEGDQLVFTQDFRFASPSTAAGVVVGGSANGRLAWKDERGRTLKELQQARTEEAR